MRSPRFLTLHAPGDADPAAEAAAGLLQPRAAVSPKFFYDALGSRLFDAITELDEYYPTRTEAAIFAAQGPAIAAAVLRHTGPSPVLVDLGAGDCRKGAALFASLSPRRYLAVDISAAHLARALDQLQREHPAMDLVGVAQDFAARLELPAELTGERALLFYPGSSIGNFDPDAARALLRQAHAASRGGALLIGVDLVKDSNVLETAYDDALGVTASFNLNLLRHLNRVLGSDFEVRDWRHVAHFDRAAGRIEMHLEARRALTVRWPGAERAFAPGERIHTENSHKWTVDGFAALLRDAGWQAPQAWTDERGWFALLVAGA